MICSLCKKKEADVHFEEIIKDQLVSKKLCEDCAKKSSFSDTFSFPGGGQPALNDLVDLLSSWHKKSSSLQKEPACPACRWTINQFQNTGMMGCSECYLHFQGTVEGVLKKNHGASIHKGKKAPSDVQKEKIRNLERNLRKLKSELDQAVKTENYELAAKLRDKIREFENKSK
ncbi:MAG: Protein-arginine kinase activator protein [Elusimicrobia bacterium]|nr:Protein-arginine kinase activator protein [Elusimicrobiota bacterium]